MVYELGTQRNGCEKKREEDGKKRRTIEREGVGEGEREEEREGDMLRGLSPSPNQKCWLHPCLQGLRI